LQAAILRANDGGDARRMPVLALWFARYFAVLLTCLEHRFWQRHEVCLIFIENYAELVADLSLYFL